MSTKPTRGRQAKPTRKEIDSYYNLLRGRADQGDIQAAAALIALAEKHTFQAPQH